MYLFIKGVNFFLLFVLFGSSIFAQEESNPNGYNTFYYPNGKISSEGTFEDGKPEGYWKTYYVSGQLKSEGNRLNHLLDGTWIFYAEDGLKTSEISYKEDLKNGPYKAYDNEGKLYSIHYYKNDVKDSLSLWYYSDGSLKMRIPIVAGLEEGTGYEYAQEDGRIIAIYKYKAGYLRSKQRVNRLDPNGEKQGKWVDFYPNGMLKSEGYYKSGKKEGVFKQYDSSGSLVELNKFAEDSVDVEAEETVILDIRSTYYEDGSIKTTGTYKEGLKEGTHRVFDKEGNIINGYQYRNGEVIAEGIVDENGFYQGSWKFFFADGSVSQEGEYVDSKKEGNWTYYYINGKKKQTGKFKNGKASGTWYWYYPSGALLREESYARGREDGLSIEYDEDENIITKGEYIDGFKEGEWYYKVGDIEEKGEYREDVKHGKWIAHYDNGKYSFKGSFIQGQPHGKHQYFYKDGGIKQQGKYKFGFKEGVWKTYDENGNVSITIKYKRGYDVKIDGIKVKPDSFLDDDLEEEENL